MGINAQQGPGELPDFAVTVRGYDRLQVDEYVARLTRWLEEAQARTAEAERNSATAASPSETVNLDGAGARIAAMLENVHAECEKIRAHAQQDAATTLAMARDSAAGIVNRSRAMAKELETEARREAAELLRVAKEG